jgi:hypothetical protein
MSISHLICDLDVEHFFMCLLATYTSPIKSYLFNSLSNLLFDQFIIWCLPLT